MQVSQWLYSGSKGTPAPESLVKLEQAVRDGHASLVDLGNADALCLADVFVFATLFPFFGPGLSNWFITVMLVMTCVPLVLSFSVGASSC